MRSNGGRATGSRDAGAQATAVAGSGDWRDEALCRHEDPELFFPVGTGPEAQEQIREAQAVCRRCPVREPCLEWALESGQTSGIWGGCSERELGLLRRRTLRQRRAASGPGTHRAAS